MRAAASKMEARTSSGVSTFVLLTSLFIQLHKPKSNAVCSGDSNSSISVTVHNYTHVHVKLFLSVTNIIFFTGITTHYGLYFAAL